MKFDMNTPPRLSGKYARDISALHNWCSILHRKLSAMFRKVENEQITSVSGDKITGDVNLKDCNYFFVGNSTNYIKFENGVLEVKTS